MVMSLKRLKTFQMWKIKSEIYLLQSCSIVAHCSDFFQVCANSSFEVFTASSNNPILSCKQERNRI